MTWSGAKFLSRERALRATGGDPERIRMLGWGDAPADSPLAMLDPIGTKRGVVVGAVPCLFHPIRWAELEPELAGIVDRFQCVEPKAVSLQDYSECSNFEIECLLLMSGAVSRERVRRMKRAAKKATRDEDEEELDAA